MQISAHRQTLWQSLDRVLDKSRPRPTRSSWAVPNGRPDKSSPRRSRQAPGSFRMACRIKQGPAHRQVIGQAFDGRVGRVRDPPTKPWAVFDRREANTGSRPPTGCRADGQPDKNKPPSTDKSSGSRMAVPDKNRPRPPTDRRAAPRRRRFQIQEPPTKTVGHLEIGDRHLLTVDKQASSLIFHAPFVSHAPANPSSPAPRPCARWKRRVRTPPRVIDGRRASPERIRVKADAPQRTSPRAVSEWPRRTNANLRPPTDLGSCLIAVWDKSRSRPTRRFLGSRRMAVSDRF